MEQLAREALSEWKKILDYWEKYAPDYQRGGFHGRVNYDNEPVLDAARSVILTSRILWTFSSAYHYFHERKYLVLADRAYHYLYNHFRDPQNGGVYWSVTSTGTPLDTRKQLYAQAFAMYGLSEYYAASKFKPALDFAKDLFRKVDKQGYDPEYGGYFESFGTKWEPVEDLILSKMPWNKSQNTHLHLIEAFTNLYRVWPDDTLRQRTGHMLDVFMTKLINPSTHRLRLFFNQQWQPKDETISYGHDIEASWLLWETAEVLRDASRMDLVKKICIEVASAACTGLGDDGALNYEFDPVTKHTNTERSWWVLAEQMVGFYNVYQLTKEEHFKLKAKKSWDFIKRYVIDLERGEWYGTVKADLIPVKGDKINFWKCPYHNSRACYEMVRRLKA